MLYANDLDSIRYSTFDPTKPTQFLVHGFIDDGTAEAFVYGTMRMSLYGTLGQLIDVTAAEYRSISAKAAQCAHPKMLIIIYSIIIEIANNLFMEQTRSCCSSIPSTWVTSNASSCTGSMTALF